VTLPPWALTTRFAAFSLKEGWNWTIASTVLRGVLDAAVARRDCAFGAALAPARPQRTARPRPRRRRSTGQWHYKVGRTVDVWIDPENPDALCPGE